MIPDYKFLINTPDGPESSLAELKIISAGKSRCPRGTTQKVSGQPEPPPGPLVRRLRSYPMMKLVAGPWGDLSEDFHILLGTFAKNKAEAEARGIGRGGGPSSGDLGKCKGQIRRAMSVQVVRSQSLCLLELFFVHICR